MTVMTITAVAAQCDVSTSTIRSWVVRGQLEPIKRGAKPLMFWEHDVQACAAARLSRAEHERLDALWGRLLDAGG